MRRLLRIFPLYYGTILACVIAAAFLHEIQGVWHEQAWLWLYGVNVKVALAGQWVFTFGTLDLNHFWTLAVEEHFYLVWPALVFLLGRRALLGMCAILLVTAPILRLLLCLHGMHTAAFAFTACRVDSLAVGAAVALLARSESGRAWLTRQSAAVLCVAVVGLIVDFAVSHGLKHEDMLTNVVGCSLTSFGAAAGIWIAATARADSLVSRVLTNRALVSVGTISYGLYVLHMIVIAFVPRGLGFVSFASVALAGSPLASLLSWHLYEKQFLKLKRFFAYGRR